MDICFRATGKRRRDGEEGIARLIGGAAEKQKGGEEEEFTLPFYS